MYCKLGLTRKSAEEIQKLALHCLEPRNITAEEEVQEVEDIKLVERLDQVRLRDDKLKAGVAPPQPVIPHEHYELLKNICIKQREIKALRLENAQQVARDEAEQLVKQSCKMIE